MKHIIIVILLLISTNLFPQWIKKEIDKYQLGAGGVIKVYDSLNVILSYNRNLYITKDGGNTWKVILFNNSIVDMDKINLDIFVLVMENGSIFRTADSGESWNEVWYNPELSTFMNYIKCFKDSIIIAMGDGNPNNISTLEKPLLLCSDDTGITWSQISIANQIGANSGDTWRRIDFITPNTGYFRSIASVFEDTQGLYKTSNGGLSWTKLEKGKNFVLIKFYDEKIGLAADQNKVYLTKDGGLSWQTSENEFGVWPNDFEFLPGDSNMVWFVNLEGLFFNNDMGMNWEEVKLQNTSLRARDIFFIDNKNGWILCDNGLLFFTNQ